MVEVVADEIGPSLRWATAQVDRNDRREGGGQGSGGPARAPAQAPRTGVRLVLGRRAGSSTTTPPAKSRSEKD